MREYAEAGNQLIVGEVFAVERAARQVAKDYPADRLPDGLFRQAAGRPTSAVFDNYIQESAYLSGMVAGGMTKTNKIGMVGGFPIPEVNRLMHAFMAGAKETNPKVKFTVTFIDTWYDPPKAKEAAFAMIDQGADLMYAERFGVSDAAKERGVRRSATSSTPRTIPRHGGRLRALAHGADHRPRTAEGQGRQVRRRGLRPLSTFETRGCSCPAGHLREEGAADVVAKVKAREGRDPGRQARKSSRRQRAQVER